MLIDFFNRIKSKGAVTVIVLQNKNKRFTNLSF